MSNRGHNLRSHIVNLPEDSKLFTVVPKEPFDIHGRYEIERTPQREELFLGTNSTADFKATRRILLIIGMQMSE